MPELIRLNDDEVGGDYLAVSADDADVSEPSVMFRGYESGSSTDVVVSRESAGRLVRVLTEWLDSTLVPRSASKVRSTSEPWPQHPHFAGAEHDGSNHGSDGTATDAPAPSTYPETAPAVFVPDYDAPNETGRALRLSAADGFVFAARTSGGVLEYDSNNSGGGWWLKDEQWEALAEAGWTVHWGARNSSIDPLIQRAKTGDRWLGALATSAAKHVPSAAEGIAEWERVTGQCAGDLGCNCCGPPHNFHYTLDNGDDSRYISPEIPASASLSGVGYD